LTTLAPDTPVFVAGHRGLIGSAFVRRLRAAGFGQILTVPRNELDLRERPAVEAWLHEAQPGLLVLCAGRVGGILENRNRPADMLAENLAIELSVLPAAHKLGVPRVIFFGSSCMYPRECPQPMSESALLSGMPEPTSLAYALAKLAGLEMCRALNAQYGSTRFYSVIPNNAYGPGDNFDPESGHVIAALIQRIHAAKLSGAEAIELWGSGRPRREFVHADDIADACCFLLDHCEDPARYPINIGVGNDVSIAELAEQIAKVIGFAGQIRFDASRPDGAPRKLLDSSRLARLGWRHTVSLEDGIRETYAWYLSQGTEGTSG
jgi:GDP-L-fucose synthase